MLFPKFDCDQMGRKTRLGDGDTCVRRRGVREAKTITRGKPAKVSSNGATGSTMSGRVHLLERCFLLC